MRFLTCIILTLLVACQPATSTIVLLPTLHPAALGDATRPPADALPTVTLGAAVTLTPTVFRSPTPLFGPTRQDPPTATLTRHFAIAATATPIVITETPTPTVTASVTVTVPGTPIGTSPPTLAPAGDTFVVGRSVEGREIIGWRFGSGQQVLMLVGGIHAGFEGNTVLLLNEIILYLQATPAAILPGISLMIVPVVNVDGLTQGRRIEGRFNANGVDLNRNWGCEWSAEAYFQNQRVDAGSAPFSEPETAALAALIQTTQPRAVVFYHSAADGIFAGNCEQDHGSVALAALLGEATGYSYGQPFTAYRVTGTAATWVDGLGIPAVDLELQTTRETEFDRNLRGLQALQCWVAGGC
jgi:predicted deacylase